MTNPILQDLGDEDNEIEAILDLLDGASPPDGTVSHFNNLDMAYGVFKLSALRKLDPTFNIAGLNQLVRVTPVEHVVPAASLDEGNWGVAFTGVEEIWGKATGRGVTVAVIDSGVNGHHEIISHAITDKHVICDEIGGANIVAGTPADSGFHGSHVASTIAGISNNVPIGLAPDARILSIQCLDGNAGTIPQTCAALNAVFDFPEVRVVNLSIELPGLSPVFSSPIKKIMDSGRIVVAAAGNTGPGRTASPGDYPESHVVSAGASTETRKIWSFSNGAATSWPEGSFGGQDVRVPLLAAPGKKIVGAASQGGLRMLSGTSMATPHVTAAIALMIEIAPNLTHLDVTQIIRRTSTDSGAAGWDMRYGVGLINLPGMIEEAEVFQDSENGRR